MIPVTIAMLIPTLEVVPMEVFEAAPTEAEVAPKSLCRVVELDESDDEKAAVEETTAKEFACDEVLPKYESR